MSIFPLFLTSIQNFNLGRVNNLTLRNSGVVSSNSSQWILDSGFDSPGEWVPFVDGDASDFSISVENSEGKLSIIGEEKTFSNISGVPQESDWTEVINPAFPIPPDTVDFDLVNGFHVSHTADETPDMNSCAQWERNVTILDDMSNHMITSATISANATAIPNYSGTATTGLIEGRGDTCDNYSTGDYVRFYILISDLNKEKQYEIAWNRTHETLGSDVGNTSMLNVPLDTVSEQKLIDYLTSVLNTDGHNFTIIVGMRIRCEDNIASSETDTFEDIFIHNLDLSFTYVSKINRLNSGSLNQQGADISDLSAEFQVVVTDANLSFSYKINQSWESALSPNSEIRILLNNNPLTKKIKLTTINTTFQTYEIGGSEVSRFLTDEVYFSLEVYLRDEFGLNRTITVSFDNVSLFITYNFLKLEEVISFLDTPFGWLVLALLIGLAAVSAYFILYQTYLKYPKFVRKIRHLRKNIKRNRSLKKPISVSSRAVISKTIINSKMKGISEVKSANAKIKDTPPINSQKGGNV